MGPASACTGNGSYIKEAAGILGNGLFTSCGAGACIIVSVRMALETVPKDLRHLRACLLCSLVKVSVGALLVGAIGEAKLEKEWNGFRHRKEKD